MNFDIPFLTPILVIAGIFIIFIVIGALRSAGSEAFSPYCRKRLITKHELVMLGKLRQALRGSGYDVFAQVSMGAVIDVKRSVDSKRRLGLRNKFDRKIIDFVVTNREGYAVLLIELDDSSHNTFRDAERDRLTRSAGYQTLRFRNAKSLNPDRIRSEIQNALAQ